LLETFELPNWFPLQKSRETSQTALDEKTWKNYIIDRINLLGPNGMKDFARDRLENQEEFDARCQKEIQSHIVLRLGVCMDPRLSAWFIESEGDLFKYRFEKSKWKEKKNILNFLFPQEDLEPTWMELPELSKYLGTNIKDQLKLKEDNHKMFRSRSGLTPGYVLQDATGMNKVIAFDFRYSNFLVKTRKSLLFRGWVIATVNKMMGTIKKRFETLLHVQLTEFATRLETAAGGSTKKLAKEINDLLHGLIKPRREYSMENVYLKGKFEDHLSYYPPCIQDLIGTVNKVGYIPHWERFQLGLFLKHTGMDVDDQLQYWYNKAVDNIGLSFDEFAKKVGYVIRHIYGLEGGRIDYEMPSCNTIQTKMFCTFRHREIAAINERVVSFLKTIKEKEKSIKSSIGREILELISRGLPSHACAKHLEFVFTEKITKIHHPMIYLKIAAKSSGVLIEDKEKATITNSNSSQNIKPNDE
jgi:DNA primase large subunit